MAGVNKAIIVGRLGQDPEIRYFQDGTPVTNFSLATSETWNDKNTGQKVEKTEWHRIVVYRRLAEICAQYLSKGRQVYIEGRIQTREWEDRDGNKRSTTEIVASNMQMLGSRADAGPGGGGYQGGPGGGGYQGGPGGGGYQGGPGGGGYQGGQGGGGYQGGPGGGGYQGGQGGGGYQGGQGGGGYQGGQGADGGFQSDPGAGGGYQGDPGAGGGFQSDPGAGGGFEETAEPAKEEKQEVGISPEPGFQTDNGFSTGGDMGNDQPKGDEPDDDDIPF